MATNVKKGLRYGRFPSPSADEINGYLWNSDKWLEEEKEGPTRAHTPFFNDSTFSIILPQGMPGVELRGFLGVLDIRARAHQYD